MKIREHSMIDRPAVKVWPYIVRPESFVAWNTKIRSMDATGEFTIGQPVNTHYVWNNKSIQCVSMPTEVRECRVLELRHSQLVGAGIRPDMEIHERITLREVGGRSHVTKIVTLKHHGVPWPFIPVVWLVANFGARVGPDPLKELCERDG